MTIFFVKKANVMNFLQIAMKENKILTVAANSESCKCKRENGLTIHFSDLTKTN